MKSSSGGTADVYMDGVLQTTINTTTTATQNRNVLYSAYGLAAGSHTFQLVVKSGTITVDFAEAQSFNTATALSTVAINDNTLGTYNNQFLYNAAWSYGSQSGAYMGDNHWSSTTNNYYQLSFVGTQVKVYTATNSNQGIAAISIDGGAETLADTYSATRADDVLIYTSPELTPGQHTVKVRVTGTKNANSTSTIITADRIDVVTPVTVNDNTIGTGNNQYQYNTTWSYYGAQSGAYNNDNHWSSVTNNYYQLSFNGTQVKVFTAKNSNQGIAGISIDGGTETLVDTYASTRSDDVLIYTSPVLTSGQHTVKVRVTSTKNASSSGYIVTADRMDVLN
jgi:riboflavin biosynthesis pyrimidine reductase